MAQEQVGNAIEAPESNDAQTDINPMPEDFFEALDQSVNAGILDESSQSTSDNNSDNTLSSPSEVQPQVSTDVETIKKLSLIHI